MCWETPVGVLISGSFCSSNEPLDHPAACAISPVLRQGLIAKQQPIRNHAHLFGVWDAA